MADGVIHLVTRFPSVTGFTEDITECTLNCAHNGVLGGGDVQTAIEAFRDFWITIAGTQVTALGAYLSATIDRGANACSVLAYATTDLDGSTPLGSPVDSLNFTLTAAGGGSEFPREVATVLSFHADLTGVPVSVTDPGPPVVVTRPQSWRRGRMYIGPVKSSAGAGDTEGILRVAPAFRTDVTQAFNAMCDTIATTDALTVGVWSKTSAEVYDVVRAYMDNAWDTQRRRGLDPTARTVIDV